MLQQSSKNEPKRKSRRLFSVFFASLVLVGALVTATVVSQPSYAAPEDYDNQSACEDAEYEWDGDASKCVEPATSSCGIEGIGWVVCPVMDFLGGVADMAFNFLADSFLSIKVEYVNSASVENAWGVMRTLANVVFVIAFLVIIFSQLTSTGISNYGVKKLLPRLIIAAILVNMSLIICQIAVDISNILGYSLKTLFETLGNDVLLNRPKEDLTGVNAALTGLGWAGLIAALLVGGITLALSISGPVLLAAVLALLLIALILVARIALITTLTIVSPLAFVAFLLPNTEQWFKKWYKMFIALLMVFPIIAVVFGASALVAEVINETAIPRDASGQPNGDPNLLMQVIAMGVATVPLFLVPSLLKNSMNAAGSIGNKLSGWSSKANSRVGSKVRDTSRLGEAQRGIKNRMALSRAMRRGKGLNRAIDNSWAGKKLGLDRGSAAAMAAVDQQDEQDVAQQLTMFKNQNGATDLKGARDEMAKAIAKGDSVKARAMQRYLAGAGGKGVQELEKVYSENSAGIRKNESLERSLASDALGLGMKGKSAAIDSFSIDSEKRSFDAIQQDSSTYSRLGASELAGQKNLKQLMSDGLVTQSMAQSVMGTEAARDLMSIGDRETMAGLAGTDLSGNPLSAAGAGSGGTQSGAGTAAPSSVVGGVNSGTATPSQTTASSGNSTPAVADPAEISRANATANAGTEIDPSWQNWHTEEAQRKAAAPGGGTRAGQQGELKVDHGGRQTPGSATSDYHDRMSK